MPCSAMIIFTELSCWEVISHIKMIVYRMIVQQNQKTHVCHTFEMQSHVCRYSLSI